MTTDGPGPWWNCRRSRIRAQWPTRLPGIRFYARGTLTYQAHSNIKAGGAATARAAARLALDELGRGITQNHMPEELTAAQESLTLAAAHWHTPRTHQASGSRRTSPCCSPSKTPTAHRDTKTPYAR